VTPSPTIRRNAVYALAAEVSRALLAAALVVAVTRILGPEQFGLFALALSIAGLAMLLSDFGVSPASGRFVAERRGDLDRVAAVVADGFRLKLVIAGALSLAVFLAAGPIAEAYDQPGLVAPLRWTAIALLAQSTFVLCVAVVVGMNRASGQLVLYTGEAVAETGLVITAVALGGGAAGAAAGRAAAFVVGAVLGIVLIVRILGPRIRPRLTRSAPDVSLVGYAFSIFLVDAAWALFASIDILMIGWYLTSTDAGLFEAVVRLTLFFTLVGSAAATAIGPRVARNENETQAVVALSLGLRGLLVFGFFGGAILLAWADPVVSIVLGPEYEGAVDAMRVASSVVALSLIAPLASASVNYLGGAARRIPIVVAALGIDILVNLLLLREIGIVAAAAATGAAYLIYGPAHIWLLHKDLGLELRPILLTAVRALLAAAAMVGVLVAFGIEDVGPLAILGGAVLGPLAFVATLVLTREISVADLRALPRAAVSLRR
jgi:O-antigen/teichoic acid export membrane protein